MADCIFCKIVAGDIPCTKVYETDMVLAFEDIEPLAPVHVILVPKRHVASLMDMEDEESELSRELFSAVRRVARIKGVDESGFRMVINTNRDGGQIIFHLHVHILGGRKLDDGLG